MKKLRLLCFVMLLTMTFGWLASAEAAVYAEYAPCPSCGEGAFGAGKDRQPSFFQKIVQIIMNCDIMHSLISCRRETYAYLCASGEPERW